MRTVSEECLLRTEQLQAAGARPGHWSLEGVSGEHLHHVLDDLVLVDGGVAATPAVHQQAVPTHAPSAEIVIVKVIT